MTVCVYALVTPTRLGRRLRGVAGEPLRVIAMDGIAAIVGDVRRRPAASPAHLRRYAAVVELLAARAAAVLPVRFGTTFADSSELILVLRSRQASIRERLRVVRGRVQMTIRVMGTRLGSDPDDGPLRGQTLVTERSRVRPRNRATQGTRYLQQRLAIARAAEQIPELEPVRGALQRFIRGERVERRGGLATVHHLIPRASAERYRIAVERAAARTGVRLTLSGPWAPYAFAENW